MPIPEYVYMMFQMTFAIITPALICGAFAERMKFSALVLFTVLWSIFIYAPIAHWVWGGGFLGADPTHPVLDFAGGTVVHINAGVAGLVCCLFMRKRVGYGVENMAPNNLVYTMIGASLLWVGWFGFNAGSAVASNDLAGAAMTNTQVATAAAAMAWMALEWIERKKPSMLGMASGAVAGLVAVTPASGFVTPTGALYVGIAAGLGCYASAVWLKKLLKYDDSLDTFGVHGVGGLIGALLTGVFASESINPLSKGHSIITQAKGCIWTIAWYRGRHLRHFADLQVHHGRGWRPRTPKSRVWTPRSTAKRSTTKPEPIFHGLAAGVFGSPPFLWSPDLGMVEFAPRAAQTAGAHPPTGMHRADPAPPEPQRPWR